ncbi:hypothetical protein ACFOET_15425 [Parapedobacter deserti]|uniref:HTH hxlR-type domain-containing protein n=1 Tax=Parapedobacter deserti TaxID=1912957 RepID=A0ABV7JM24_9SPHI
MISQQALDLLRLLRRWSTGSIRKFAEELHVEASDLVEAVFELRTQGLLVAYEMHDGEPFSNAMLEITQWGLDFIETVDGQISTEE